MYSILGTKLKQEFKLFKDAFDYQQEHCPNKVIICSNDEVVEVV